MNVIVVHVAILALAWSAAWGVPSAQFMNWAPWGLGCRRGRRTSKDTRLHVRGSQGQDDLPCTGGVDVWLIAFRDLQMRRRRFVIAIIAVGLVFGITLLLDGFSHSIKNEVRRTVAAFHGDSWLVPRGSTGPFTATHLAAEDSVRALTRSDSSVRLGAVLAFPSAVTTRDGGLVNVNVVGSSLPVALSSGRWPRTGHELVTNDDLGIGVGTPVVVSGERYSVVGETAHLRYFAGTNVVFMRLVDAQQLFVFGQRIVSGFVVHGAIFGKLPEGLITMTNAQVMASLREPVRVAASTISFLDVLLWVVAAGIIGTILYMTALERLRDFAALEGDRRAQLPGGDRNCRAGTCRLVRVCGDCLARIESTGARVSGQGRDPVDQLPADLGCCDHRRSARKHRWCAPSSGHRSRPRVRWLTWNP